MTTEPNRFAERSRAPGGLQATVGPPPMTGTSAGEMELIAIGEAILDNPQEGLRQVRQALRTPGTGPGRTIDLTILQAEGRQRAGLRYEALVSARAAVKAAEDAADPVRLTTALGAQADALVCFGGSDAVQGCGQYLDAVMRPALSQAVVDIEDQMLRTVLAGALRAVAIYHRTSCDQARALTVTLLAKTPAHSPVRAMLMAAGAAMDTGCTYNSCRPPNGPLPAVPGLVLVPRLQDADVDWLAARLRLYPATHACELFAQSRVAPHRGVKGELR